MERPALKGYQWLALAYAQANPYCILALDPGLGKSRIAIEVAETHRSNCLIICPSYLILNWVKEIKKWSVNPNAQVCAFRAGKDMYSPVDADYVITSYDLVQKAPYLFEWADMVVLDEAHSIKSMKAKRTEFIHRHIYENSVPRVHLLTGTPIKNRVQEFYSLLALCHYNPSAADSQFLDLFPSEIDFADRYSIRREYTMEVGRRLVTIVKWEGLRHVEELKKWLEGKYFRIKSSDVLDLPPITYKSILVAEAADPALLESFNAHFSEDGADSVNPTAKAEAALKKVPFTVKYVENLLEEVDCALVYTDHVASARELARLLGVEAITGEMSSTKRSKLSREFQEGQGRVLVATIGSLKEGVDLYRSSHIVFNDYSWVPGDMKQVAYRIQRVGQKNHCTVHHILGSPQDEYILGVIESKLKTIEKAT